MTKVVLVACNLCCQPQMSLSQILRVADPLLGLFSVYLVIRIAYFALRSSRPLPPGPKGLPLIGNLLDLPKGLEGQHWAKHRALYGKIVSILYRNDRTNYD